MTDHARDGFSQEHRSPEEIAAYLGGALSAADREGFEAHLAACRACRWEVTTARRLTHARPRDTGRTIALAAAAVLVGVLLTRQLDGIDRGPRVDPQRPSAERASGAQAIDIVFPEERGTVEPPGIAFVWRPLPGSYLYRLTLSTDDGRNVWTADTRDSTLALPPHVVLERGQRYLWYVDALGSDTRSSTSGVHHFSTRR